MISFYIMSLEHLSEKEAYRRKYYNFLTDEQYILMNELHTMYWGVARVDFIAVLNKNSTFLETLSEEEHDQLHDCILYHVILGSTPTPKQTIFDIDGKLEAYIRGFAPPNKL